MPDEQPQKPSIASNLAEQLKHRAPRRRRTSPLAAQLTIHVATGAVVNLVLGGQAEVKSEAAASD